MNAEPGRWGRSGPVALWAAAGLASLVLNLLLFLLLPGLVDRTPVRPEAVSAAHPVNVIRMKRPETPVRKREPRKPVEPPKEQKAYTRKPPVPPEHEPVPQQLRMSFTLNPKLPPQRVALPSPEMRSTTIGAPAFKASYGVGEIDRPLAPLANPPPVYPMRARRRGIEGWVRVRFLVHTDGTVEAVEVVEAKPPDVFDKTVVRSVSNWRFEPGTVDGVPVTTRVETTIHFQLQ